MVLRLIAAIAVAALLTTILGGTWEATRPLPPLVVAIVFFVVVYAIVIPSVYAVGVTLTVTKLPAYVSYVILFVALHGLFNWFGSIQNDVFIQGGVPLVLNHELTPAGWKSIFQFMAQAAVTAVATAFIIFNRGNFGTSRN